jgi:hypothetical protein
VHGEVDCLKRRRDSTSSTLEVVAGARSFMTHGGLQGGGRRHGANEEGSTRRRAVRLGDIGETPGDAQPHAEGRGVGFPPQEDEDG